MFTMKDLGHTLPGHLLVRQNLTFANSIDVILCNFFKKKPYKPQSSKFAKFAYHTKGPFPML